MIIFGVNKMNITIPLSNIISFLIETFFNLISYLLIFRLLIVQYMRSDFHHPLTQLIIQSTNFLLKMSNHITHRDFNLNLSICTILYLFIYIQITFKYLLVSGNIYVLWDSIFFLSILKLVLDIIWVYIILVFIITIFSWINPGPFDLSLFFLIKHIAQPLFKKIKKFIPSNEGFDYSSVITIAILSCLYILISSIFNI